MLNFFFRGFFLKNKNILQNTFFVFALSALQKVLGLATVFVLVRTLDQNQFGDYQFILSLIGILTIFSLPGLNSAVMQSTARGMEGTFRASLKPSFLSALLGSLILFGIGSWYLFVKHDDLFVGYYFASILFPFAYSLQQWKSLKAGKEQFSSLLIIDGVGLFLTAIAIIAMALFFPGNVAYPIFAALLVPGIKNLIFTFSSLRKIDAKAEVEKGSILYGIKINIYFIFHLLANHIDKILVYSLLSPVSLAVYYAADRLAEIVRGGVQDIAAVLAPRFAKKSHYTPELDKILFYLSIGLGGIIVVVAFTILPNIITLLFGQTYQDAIPYAQALLCSVVIGNHAALKSKFISAKLDEQSYRDITISTSLIRIVASAVCIFFGGLWGAVVANFIYRISTAVIVNMVIKKRYKDLEGQSL